MRHRALLAAGGGAEWSPALLNPALWLDASDAASITESGGAVSAWADKGPNGYSFVQSTAGSKPATGVTTQNGLNVLSFTGNGPFAGGDWLRDEVSAAHWTFLHDGTNHLVAIVAKSTAGGQIYMGNGQGNGERGLMFYAYTAAGTWLYFPYSSNQASASGGTTPHILTFLTDGDNATPANRSAIFKNAGAAVKNNTISTTPSASAPQYKLAVGAAPYNDSQVTYGLTGWLAEIVIVAGAAATEESRTLLRDHLNEKWAVY